MSTTPRRQTRPVPAPALVRILALALALTPGPAVLASWAAAGPVSESAPAAVPLHERIDRLIEAKLARELPGQAPAAPATDGEFLRRAWLDLAGMIPGADEARDFLDDPTPYKRQALVDRLLSSPLYARRMQQVFDVMLMERRPDLFVEAKPWSEFLHQAFAENRPYDVLVRQILAADGTDPATRPVARFLLAREGDPNLITRDLGRLFLGVDLQCCQCHDHPLIDGYSQQDYYGLYAFVSRTVILNGKQADGSIKPGSVAVLGEKADGEVTFSSVFKKKVIKKTGPRVLGGPPLAEPAILKGQEYLIPPDPNGQVPPVPAYSRRALLGPSLTGPGTPAFARNIANRLWALVFGRGIVHPVDLHHKDNPPSNPELMDLLAGELAAMHYDLKAFIRELVLTRAYARSSEPPPDCRPELSEPGRFAVATLRPLAPEPLAWSVMQAVGLLDATRTEAAWQLDGADPRMKAILSLDAKRKALREAVLEEKVFVRLEPNVRSFVSHFGGVQGQPQESVEGTATVDQALFLSNGQPVRAWLAPHAGWLIGRAAALADATAVAEELYLGILSAGPPPTSAPRSPATWPAAPARSVPPPSPSWPGDC